MHVHLVLVGSLFFWPLLGVDPLPGRVAYPFRVLMVFLTLPFHAFLGVTIMQQTEPDRWLVVPRPAPGAALAARRRRRPAPGRRHPVGHRAT